MSLGFGNRNVIEIFICPKCKETFWRGSEVMTCAVLHAYGDCCHYSDVMLTKDQVMRVTAILSDRPPVTNSQKG